MERPSSRSTAGGGHPEGFRTRRRGRKWSSTSPPKAASGNPGSRRSRFRLPSVSCGWPRSTTRPGTGSGPVFCAPKPVPGELTLKPQEGPRGDRALPPLLLLGEAGVRRPGRAERPRERRGSRRPGLPGLSGAPERARLLNRSGMGGMRRTCPARSTTRAECRRQRSRRSAPGRAPCPAGSEVELRLRSKFRVHRRSFPAFPR
jgi:hypothetical protein